jgi:hypothetical protein
MLSLYTHASSHHAAFRRLFFQHNFKHATYPLQRAPFLSPLRTSYLSRHVTPGRITAAVGTGLAGAGLGLSFYANSRKLNCECESLLILINESWLRTGKSWGHHLFTTPINSRIGNARPSASPSSPRVRCQYVRTHIWDCMRCLHGHFRQEGCKGPRISFWRNFCIVAGERPRLYMSHGMPFPKYTHNITLYK